MPAKVFQSAYVLSHRKATGAIANFDEAYGERVRVVKIGEVSAELCGGTHLEDAVGVYPFHILGESSVAMGTRRIEVHLHGLIMGACRPAQSRFAYINFLGFRQ